MSSINGNRSHIYLSNHHLTLQSLYTFGRPPPLYSSFYIIGIKTFLDNCHCFTDGNQDFEEHAYAPSEGNIFAELSLL